MGKQKVARLAKLPMDYQVISSYITAHKKYVYEHFPVFLISKNGEKLGDDPKYLTYTQSAPEFDPITQRHYRITYAAEKIIETFVGADVLRSG